MRFWIPLIFLAFIASCKPRHVTSDQVAPVPDTIVPSDTMVLILTDMHLAEAAISSLKNKGGADKGITDRYYMMLFSKYHISRKTFEANFDYYKTDQDRFIKMYEEVISNLDGMLKKQKNHEE